MIFLHQKYRYENVNHVSSEHYSAERYKSLLYFICLSKIVLHDTLSFTAGDFSYLFLLLMLSLPPCMFSCLS